MEFTLKTVRFLGRDCNVICQNENGPCPLIAIANVLLLQNRISISTDRSFIALSELVQIIANKVLEGILVSKHPEHGKLLESVFNILPKLANGLDLNVIFSSVNKFEFTEEMSLFDALGIPLLHGWLYDVNDSKLSSAIGDLSYNHLIFKVVDYKTLLDKMNQDPSSNSTNSLQDNKTGDTQTADTVNPTGSSSNSTSGQHATADLLDLAYNSQEEEPIPAGAAARSKAAAGVQGSRADQTSSTTDTEEQLLLEHGQIYEQFLSSTAPQLTQAGVLGLYNFMRDRQLAVLFRNNHFSTIFCLNGQLFILVTDLGYLHEPSVVWELLALDGVAG